MAQVHRELMADQPGVHVVGDGAQLNRAGDPRLRHQSLVVGKELPRQPPQGSPHFTPPTRSRRPPGRSAGLLRAPQNSHRQRDRDPPSTSTSTSTWHQPENSRRRWKSRCFSTSPATVIGSNCAARNGMELYGRQTPRSVATRYCIYLNLS